ncbi:RNA-binding S4 domain-containing protein [Myxococcota bacterium]|nr:RNA-binding S4 domain-containing protein [Myxococcota bacterium]
MAPADRSDHSSAPSAEVRLDKWLWAARCFKTRGAATEACDGGHCTVDGRPGKPGQRVRVGQRIEVQTPGGQRVLVVVALADKRGSATEARALFEDHSPPPPVVDPVERLMRSQPVFARTRGAGRPTKRDRRLLDRERGTP